MKKTIALSFLFFANAILLAHAIVIHHHYHWIQISAATAQHEHTCNSNENCRHDDAQPDDHCNNPFCHGNIKNCPLELLYIKIDNDNDIYQPLDFELNLLPSFSFLSLFPDYSISKITDGIGLPFRQKPYLLSYHTDYISQSLGLRAPPFYN